MQVIIKACEPGTSGRYVTVVGPNRVYPSPDNLYLSLCEVAVYGGCPPLPAAALSNTLSAAEAAAAESLGTCSGQYLCQLGGFCPPFFDCYGSWRRFPESWRQDGENGEKTGKKRAKMGEKWPKKSGGKLT